MAQQEYQRLIRGSLPDTAEPLSVELVFAEPLAQGDVASRVAEALPEAELTVAAAFTPELDRFHFVDFPDIDPRGQESPIFAFARALSAATGAAEGNPVLPDSLYGADHVGAGEDESVFSVCETPRDETLPRGWHYPRIHTPGAWAHSKGQGTTVAVIDTGYSGHDELQDVISHTGERNFVEGGNDARDRFSSGSLRQPGHGTLVMSVIASRGTADDSGNTGAPGTVTGTAPDAKVMPIRAIRSVVYFSQRNIGPAIGHAVANGADVISMALGGPTRVAGTEAGLRAAVDAGVVIVCAAGNCWPWVVFPAAYAPMGICTAVAALQPDERPWAKTGSGSEVTLSAFGEHVWGAAKNRPEDPDSENRASQGTTLATSMTAGVAALWVAHHGGRAALLAEAQSRGTTVQAMWVHCATFGLAAPTVWNGSSDLGAGVLDANLALTTPLPSGPEASGAPGLAVVPTINLLQAHLASTDAAAAAELTPEMADLASELIWLSYRAGAKRRAMQSGAETVLHADVPSEAVAAALRDRPALRAKVGG